MNLSARNLALLKYALLQLPELGLIALAVWFVSQWWTPPLWLSLLAAALWLAKEAFLFTRVRASLDDSSSLSGSGRLIGRRAIAVGTLAPEGWVRVGSELWRAELGAGVAAPVAEGTPVRVCAVEGLRLRVTPEEDDEPAR